MMKIPFLVGPVFILLVVWSLCWKGAALWRAGRRNELGWFIALLLINTLGILEVVYLLVFAKDKKEGASVK